MRSSLALLCCCVLLSAASAGPARAQCAGGTVSASVSLDPGFENLYKYCLDVQWDVGDHELSHLDLFLVLPDCPCLCSPQFIHFGSPAGTSVSSSTGDPCELPYLGEYVCKGDPSLPNAINGPAVKFVPDPASTCAPGVAGSGHFCFYSPMPPQDPGSYNNGIAIKHGLDTCYGILQGQLPSCDCALPTHAGTWGALKAAYR
jgi:hypothetical protein